MSAEHLIDRCIAAYWQPEMGNRGISSRIRMRAVFDLLATEISSWAPDKGQARICHLAVNEVADRIRREGDPDTLAAAFQAQPASAAPSGQ